MSDDDHGESVRAEATDTLALFNPAFAAALLANAATAHAKTLRAPMPMPLAFIIVPLAVHEPFRSQLPGNRTKRLAAWLASNPEVRAAFPVVARDYVEMTRRGIRFGIRTGALAVEDGSLVGRVAPVEGDLTDEVRKCLEAARLAGRWIGVAGTPATTFPLFGVRP